MKVNGNIAISILLGMCRRSSALVLPRNSQLLQSRVFQSFPAIHARPDIFYEDESECADEDECEIDWGAMPGFESVGDDDRADEDSDRQSMKATIDIVHGNGGDPDCPEEDECEIDWGAMPGFEDNEDDNNDDDAAKEQVPKKDRETTGNTVSKDEDPQLHLIGDETDELEPQEAYVRQVERSVEKSRTIFEMNWQIENCIVDEDTCTDFCSECAGSGKSRCEFCRGTRVTSFQNNDFRPCLICNGDGQVECSACSGTGSISPWAKTHDGDAFRRIND